MLNTRAETLDKIVLDTMALAMKLLLAMFAKSPNGTGGVAKLKPLICENVSKAAKEAAE